MFSLEQSIAEWRKQMLAAGIKSPVPLEELENHLREEIERQVKVGLSEQQAFHLAARQIGEAEQLNKEFNTSIFLDWLGQDGQTRINRSFALFWLVYCAEGFFAIVAPLTALVYGMPNFRITPDFLLVLLMEVIFLRGIIASIRLFGGKNKEIRMLKSLAVMGLALFVAQIIVFKTASLLAIVGVVFNVASLWLMRVPSQGETSIAMK
jgi:hypothetical protein